VERGRRRFVIMRRDGALLRNDGHRKTRRPTAAGRSARPHRARGHPPLRRGPHTPEGAREAGDGGYLVGERSIVFVFEADSEEEVHGVLEDLPLSGVVTAELRPMQPLGEMHTLEDL
jgi:hypothetical protein